MAQPFSDYLHQFAKEHNLPDLIVQTVEQLYDSYSHAAALNGYSAENIDPHLEHLIQFAFEQIQHPFVFEPFHEAIRSPFDYYQFGIDFIRPLIDLPKSTVHHIDNVDRIERQLQQGDNVILLANHQIEPDPQVISVLLQSTHPQLAENMIFVAGHRVISDPLAVPFSKGRNLLCIFSKKHIENPPEQKPEKLLHNQKTMRRLSQLLDEGGKCIYVAPSGGRDRANPRGEPEVAHFDPNSVEMFWLLAQQAKRITHFYPLALATYHILPPPTNVQKELGEKRQAKCTPVHIAFGEEIDMENLGLEQPVDKKHRRKFRADYIYNLVKQDYLKITRQALHI